MSSRSLLNSLLSQGLVKIDNLSLIPVRKSSRLKVNELRFINFEQRIYGWNQLWSEIYVHRICTFLQKKKMFHCFADHALVFILRGLVNEKYLFTSITKNTLNVIETNWFLSSCNHLRSRYHKLSWAEKFSVKCKGIFQIYDPHSIESVTVNLTTGKRHCNLG